MKFINTFLEKLGVDKLLHFLTGALITALFYPYGFLWSLTSVGVVVVLSIIKEIIDGSESDNTFDSIDLASGILGSGLMCLYYLLI